MPEAVLGTEAQYRIMVPTLREQTVWGHGSQLTCVSSGDHLVCNSGPHPQTRFFIFLKHLAPNSHFMKHWSGAMGEIYYQAHVADEETEVQRGRVICTISHSS